MLTEFGVCLRTIRAEKRETAKDMAKRMNISSAYLSAMENGKRNIPSEFVEKLSMEYRLDEKNTEILKENSVSCQDSFKINVSAMDEFSKKIILSIVSNKVDEPLLREICDLIDIKQSK